MRAFFRRFGDPLEHPEFMWPGFLMLMIGIMLGIAFWIGGGNGRFFLYAPVFVVCGIALLLKRETGSVLFVGILAFSFFGQISRLETGWREVVSATLGLLVLFSFAACAIEQFKYHRKRRTQPPSELIPPSPSPQV